MDGRYFIFRNLFEQLRHNLGYHVGFEKYKSFLDALDSGYLPIHDLSAFKRHLEYFFLEKNADKEIFVRIIDEILLDDTYTILKDMLSEPEEIKGEIDKPGSKGEIPEINDTINEEHIDIEDDFKEEQSTAKPTPPKKTEKIKEKDTKTQYLDFSKGMSNSDTNPDLEMKPDYSKKYNLSDEYFPVSRRQLIKNWRYLRHKEDAGYSDEVDVWATVLKIAKNKILDKPVYKSGTVNRKNILYVFADIRGSMTPFHELTNRIIHTAKTEGGHRDAEVYYFNNFPNNFLFRKNNLSGSVPISKALSRANKQYSVAMVISDAGAAKGEKVRMEKGRPQVYMLHRDEFHQRPFITDLKKHFSFVLWLNPMPKHRWKNTPAELIARELPMFPLLDEHKDDLQFIIKSMMSKNKMI